MYPFLYLFFCFVFTKIANKRVLDVVVLAKIERTCYNTHRKTVYQNCHLVGWYRFRRDTKMPTSVVVATIVNTNMSEAGFRQHVGDQLRVNDRSLLDKLAAADGDANVVTTVLNVDEFLAYLIRRFPKAVDAAISTGEMPDSAAAVSQSETPIDTAKMSEGEFMDYMLKQLDAGEIEPMVRFSDEEWEDDGDIGEDISRYPFFY
jgi:hypothetical protein